MHSAAPYRPEGQPSPKYDILESGRRIGTVHNANLAAQIVAEIARRDAKAAAEWAVRS
ncbi:hypothetical protein [Aquamicrobium soli]|uniref:Uncharacterized protein n=1 Tax=Aquamicrobium soli TaxID=1811518 RepID=A0ABV7KEB3_9HYPH